MKHTPNLAVNKCDSLYAQIQQKVADTGLQHTHLIGRAKGQKMYVDLMIQEVILFVSLSLLLTVIFLFIAFRSAVGVVIPSLIVLLTIIFTLAFMKILGKDMDLMLTILPTIIFVVGMSDSVHVLTKYLQELREGKEKVAAIKSAFKSIRLATFLTALTTAIGFLTLIFSSIQPISDFGVYTSIGVLLAYGLTYTLLPAILILSKPTRLNSFAMSEDFWTKYLHRWFAWVLSNRKKILVGMGIAIVIAGVGIFSIQVDNLMVEDLKDDHPIRQDFAFMEERFAGCRPFELCLELPAGQSAYDSAVLQELDSLGKYIRQHYQAGALFSLAEVVKSANRSLNAGMEDYRMIPTDSLELRQVRRFVQRRDLAAVTDLTYNQERHWLRVTGRMSDAGRQHYDSLNHEMTQYIQHSCPHLGKPHVTGTAFLMDLNNGYLVDNMLLDLLLSVSVIGFIMGLVYRSWRMIPLTIIPNLIPLILVAGIMGFAGIQLKISTSIIFNIAFGIAVDDTIHFLARVRTYQTHGKSPLYAVKRTFLTTGKAMVVTTLILSGGFVTLMFSDFLGSFYIGFLISLTLFIALICELLISPLLLILYRVEKKGN
jgi:predicted RND superfamily exporter protein